MPKTGVLLTGFGGPESLDAVQPFMCNLMGREPSEELVQRICRRYLAVGGSSPLNEVAVEIAGKLEVALAGVGLPSPVAVGMRYAPPFIDDALAALKELGCERVVVVSLSPFESKVAHGAYREAIDEACTRLGGLEIIEAPLVSELEEYAKFFAMSTSSSIVGLEPNEGAIIVFTAHSLPLADLVEDDPYAAGLERTANEIAEQLGLDQGVFGSKEAILSGMEALGSVAPPRAWFLAYQSKGARGGEWLGPDLDDVIDAIGRSGASSVVVVPIGFMTDHLETMYDIDIDAAGRALDAGLEFNRAAVPNADDDLVEAIARSIADLS